jgi:hypothetical protein
MSFHTLVREVRYEAGSPHRIVVVLERCFFKFKKRVTHV